MGRIFVLTEVRIPYEDRDAFGNHFCKPIDDKGHEVLWVHPDRIIDGDRLRYGGVAKGDLFLTDQWDWKVALTGPYHNDRHHRLILDPPPAEKSEWEKWVDECPIHYLHSEYGRILDWLKREPKRGE